MPENVEGPRRDSGASEDHNQGAGEVFVSQGSGPTAADHQTVARAARTLNMRASEFRSICAELGADPLAMARTILRGQRGEASRAVRRRRAFRPRAVGEPTIIARTGKRTATFFDRV